MKLVTYLGSFVQLCCGEGGTLQTNITGMCGECSQCMNHTGFAPAHSTCAFLVYTAQAPGCSEGELSKAALGRMHFPSLSCSDSGSQLFHKGTDSVGPAFCGLPMSRSSGDQVLGESTVPGVWCILSPPCSQLLGFLGAQQECCLRCAMCLLWRADLWLQPSWWMSTVQDPRKRG